MVGRARVGKLGMTFVFRHFWETKETKWTHLTEWSSKEFGIFWRKNLAVGSKIKGKGAFKHENLIPCLMIGVRLGWVKFWVDLEWGRVLSMKVND